MAFTPLSLSYQIHGEHKAALPLPPHPPLLVPLSISPSQATNQHQVSISSALIKGKNQLTRDISRETSHERHLSIWEYRSVGPLSHSYLIYVASRAIHLASANARET